MKKLLLQLLVSLSVLGLNYAPVYSQGFITIENNIDEKADVIALADLDLNNTVELLMIDRIDASNSRISIYNGLATLTKLNEISIPGLDNPKLSTVDFNNDGRLELVVSGNIEGKPYLDILKGSAGLNYTSLFNSVPQLNLPFKIIDFNHDGKLDLLGSLYAENDDSLRVYLNKGGSLNACQNCLSGLKGSPELLIDIANDGSLDLLVSNETGLHFYENLGTADSINYNLFPEFTDDLLIDYGDMNQDGVDEVVIAGLINQTFSFSIMELDTNGLITIKNHQVVGEPRKMRIADFTNDGDLDILLQEGDSLLLYQMDSIVMTTRHVISGDLDSVSFDITDLDRDMDLDIIVSGTKQSDYKLHVKNNDNILNGPPSNPGNLFAIPRGDSVQLIWGRGSDDTTPSKSLTYELYLLDDNGKAIVPWYSGTNRSITDYGRQLHTREYIIKDLPSGIYNWAVQSVDNSLVGTRCIGPGPDFCISQFEVGLSTEKSHDVCSGDTLEISLEPSITTSWYSLNRGFIQESETLTYVVDENDVIYTNYLDDGCTSLTHSEEINVYQNPELKFENFYGCVGDMISYSIGEEIESATWEFLNLKTVYHNSSVSIPATISDTLVLSVIGIEGCLSKDTILINVNERPKLEFDNFDGCAGDMISYSIEEEIESASWEFLQLQTTFYGPSISVPATINDTLVLEGIGKGGCLFKDTIMINVYEKPQIQFDDFKGCEGDMISYSIEEEIETATWKFLESGESYSGSSISISAKGHDVLILSATAGCWSIQDTIRINVSERPDINAGPDLEVDYGESIQLGARGGVSYSWSPASDLDDPYSPNPRATPDKTTTYTVIGYNEAGCVGEDGVVVRVVPVEVVQQLAFVPNLFSPNDNGHNDELKVLGDNIANAEFKVFDSRGHLVFSTQVRPGSSPPWDGMLNGRPLPQGTYVWSLTGRYTDGSSIAEVGPASGTVTLIR